MPLGMIYPIQTTVKARFRRHPIVAYTFLLYFSIKETHLLVEHLTQDTCNWLEGNDEVEGQKLLGRNA